MNFEESLIQFVAENNGSCEEKVYYQNKYEAVQQMQQ